MPKGWKAESILHAENVKESLGFQLRELAVICAFSNTSL
jgi:hypothetical protein